jgi:hypothetical protein
MTKINAAIEDFNEHNDRLEGFAEVASDAHFHGHAVLRTLSVGLAPLACAIEGAMLCFHLIPKLYKHINNNGDFERQKSLTYKVAFAIPVTIFGVAALAVGGAAAALPLGIVSAGIKTMRATYDIASNKSSANIVHTQDLRHRLAFNLFGLATLAALVIAPPVGVVMGLAGLSASGAAIAVSVRQSVKSTGIKAFAKSAWSHMKNIFTKNSAPVPAPGPEAAPVVINTERQVRAAVNSNTTHAPPHAFKSNFEPHPELQGEFKPKHSPSLETIAEEDEEEDAKGPGE